MKITSIKPKIVSYDHLLSKAMRESGNRPSELRQSEDGSLNGLIFPLTIRVRTVDGIRITNGIFTTEALTIVVRFEDGTSFEGTNSHKLMLSDRASWITLEDLRAGMSVATDIGSMTVTAVTPGDMRTVADISVPGPHSYLLENGVVSHNSILANQLNLNQSELGYKSVLVPLEMSSPEMLARSAASLSGHSSLDIFLKRMATGEKDNIWRRFTKFDKRVAKAGGRYTIFKPKEDLTIEELMAALHTFNSDVIYVDYIGLLKGADGEDQWRRLGQIARYSKIYAEANNKVMVLLVQISEEGRIRYSQAIKEHASLAWMFVATKETKERGYMNIELLKSRNQSDKPFTLSIDYAKMHVRDLSTDEMKRIDPKDKSKGKDDRKAGSGKSTKDGSSDDLVPGLEE